MSQWYADPARRAELVSSSQIIEALSLRQWPGPQLTRKTLDQFAARVRTFGWLHAGTADIPISTLFSVIRSSPIAPPRSGHLGNWSPVIDGRAGSLDCNILVCRDGALGYPLLFDLNQTENDAMTSGDVVYLPGSRIDADRERLTLYAWTGSRFARQERDVPRLVPLLMTEGEGGLVPLASLHRARSAQMAGFEFRYHSSELLAREERLRDVLIALIDEASGSERLLPKIVDRVVRRDGVTMRVVPSREGPVYRLGDLRFDDARALVDAVLLPLRIAADASLLDRPGDLPETMPLLSAELNTLLYALLKLHYPSGGFDRPVSGVPFDIHMHWGADQMAGYPPRKRGYFVSGVADIARMAEAVIERVPWTDPLFYLLLPLSIFYLCPSSAFDGDRAAMEALLSNAAKMVEARGRDTSGAQRELESLAERWYMAERARLSDYFRHTFAGFRSVWTEGRFTHRGQPAPPAAFEQLTVRQACILAGALHEVVGRDERTPSLRETNA